MVSESVLRSFCSRRISHFCSYSQAFQYWWFLAADGSGMMIFLTPCISISANVVALPRVMAISVPWSSWAISAWFIHSRACMFSIGSKSDFIPLLSFPRAIIHSYRFLSENCFNMASKIDLAPWLPQMTRICFLSVFQAIVDCLLDWFENTGSNICPTTSHLLSLKYFFAESNPRNTFVAIFPRSWLDRPGIVSDSWI